MDERTSGESDEPLVGQSTEETRPDNTTATLDCIDTNTADLVAQHTADRDEELQKVLKQIKELTATVTEKEARCNKLKGIVAD